jgi:hypothetical protein
VKQRFIRVGDELADEITVVVRGGTLGAELLRQDALRNHAIYATYGISVFAARDASVDELAQQTPLVRFVQLTLITVGTLRAAGLRPQPATLRHRLRRPRRRHHPPARLPAPGHRQSVP